MALGGKVNAEETLEASCGNPCASATASSFADTPKCLRMLFTTLGPVATARRRLRPPHRVHTKTSKPKLRLSSVPQSISGARLRFSDAPTQPGASVQPGLVLLVMGAPITGFSPLDSSSRSQGATRRQPALT